MPLKVSVPVGSMEVISSTYVSPLISKCRVKVCYVGDEPNRNNTVITKEVAMKMGEALPGSPVVGYFNEDSQDFEEHNKAITIKDGKYQLVETTKPYGFVPTDAIVGFQKFNEDGVEREYLITECYLWTETFPECKRVIEKGNNQSMELTKDSGNWADGNNFNRRIFIYSEALIEKLCLLGENFEPCFEGAQITSFSLNPEDQRELINKMYSMMSELQETLNKGGSQVMENNNPQTPEVQTPVVEPTPQVGNEYKGCGGGAPAGGAAPKKEEEPKQEPKKPEEEENKKKYNLEEVTEYQELLGKYNALQSQYSLLQGEKEKVDKELVDLRQFKLTTDRQAKQDMINSFSMLTDEQKKDVVDHIDTYSLDDIEAKLAIQCVRNNVFNAQPQQQQEQQPAPQNLFSLAGGNNNSNVPDWIKAVQAVQG